MQFAELIADIDKDTVLGLSKVLMCLQDGLVFFREFVSLSTPVEYFPLERKAGVREVRRDDGIEIPKCHVDEAGAHIGDIFGLFDAAVYFGLLDLESRLAYFGPLLERTIPCVLQVGRKTVDIGRRVYSEIYPHITAKQVIELFLFGGEFIREIERLIFRLGKARFDVKAGSP